MSGPAPATSRGDWWRERLTGRARGSEAWRYQGQFTRWNRFRRGFPGLGIATAAFAAYCTYEYFFLNEPPIEGVRRLLLAAG